MIGRMVNLKYFINAGIATTGFDHKPIQTVIVNRATTSDNLLLQILGGEVEYPKVRNTSIY